MRFKELRAAIHGVIILVQSNEGVDRDTLDALYELCRGQMDYVDFAPGEIYMLTNLMDDLDDLIKARFK